MPGNLTIKDNLPCQKLSDDNLRTFPYRETLLLGRFEDQTRLKLRTPSFSWRRTIKDDGSGKHTGVQTNDSEEEQYYVICPGHLSLGLPEVKTEIVFGVKPLLLLLKTSHSCKMFNFQITVFV